MLARIAALDEQLEEQDTPFEKRGRSEDLSLTRQHKAPKQMWKAVEVGSSKGQEPSWDPMNSPMIWTPGKLDVWNPERDPVHDIKSPGPIWDGPKAPGHPLSPKAPKVEETVHHPTSRYNGEFEDAFKQVKPARNWADMVAVGPAPSSEVELPQIPQPHDFPALSNSHHIRQAPIARPSKGKSVVLPSHADPNEVEELSKDGYRFQTPRGRPPVKRALAF